MFIPIRRKLFVFSLLLALLPLGFAGSSMITIAQDELKSAVNDQLVDTAGQLAAEMDLWLAHSWRPPLLLLRDAIDNPALGVTEKVGLLENAITSLDAVLAVQLIVGEFPPAFFLKSELNLILTRAGVQPQDALPAAFGPEDSNKELVPAEVVQILSSDILCLPLKIPLRQPISGQKAYLMAYIDLRRIFDVLRNHPFTRGGRLFLVNRAGKTLFQSEADSAQAQAPLQTAKDLLQQGSRVVGVENFQLGGRARLGGYAMTASLPWAVVVTLDTGQAYQTVSHMRRQLLIWVSFGLLAALAVALGFARHLLRPVEAITEVAQQVGGGDLSVRVPPLTSRDELALLGEHINDMIQGLLERFHLQKFVSGGTIDAVKHAGSGGVKLGGERRYATVFFSDIRGFTSFSEKVGPETVIRMLNTYLHAQADIVKQFRGDIDKFVGDELVAVFQGDDMVDNAVLCALEIQRRIQRLNEQEVDWNIAVGIGINTGDMVMGAMGSEDRMDYTILGDTVNLGARLCSAAEPGKILISHTARNHLDAPGVVAEPLEPIRVKGKAQPIEIYQVREAAGNKIYPPTAP